MGKKNEKLQKQDAEALLNRVQELEDQWINGLGGLREVGPLLDEAREILGGREEEREPEPWRLKLARLISRLATLQHARKIAFQQIHAIYRVDPLFEPSETRMEKAQSGG